jgi:hypothetical protein
MTPDHRAGGSAAERSEEPVVISHQQAKRRASEHLRVEGSTFTVSHATRDHRCGVWIIGYRDPALPDEMLDGGGLVVTDAGDVHDLGSAPVPWVTSCSRLADRPLRGWPTRMPARVRVWRCLPYFRALLQFVDRERAKHKVYPEPHEMFAAFQHTDYKKLKVIILGQDPCPPAPPGQRALLLSPERSS